jgi:predicted kinase
MYLKAARRFLAPAAVTVTAVGGLSGSGKSTYARAVAAGKGRAPGAVILRSDELRKRLWNWPSLERLPPEAYGPEQSQRTYGHLFALGQVVARAGQSVILDATFREAHWRDQAEATAAAAFDGVWLEVDRETRKHRVSKRTFDVSDATPDVAGAQEAVELAAISWQILNPTQGPG